MIRSFPVVVIFQTDWPESAAVTWALSHWVMVRLLVPLRIRFSVVLENRPITAPLPAASYASWTVL